MEYRTLNVKGAILSQSQLERYLEIIASDHNLKPNSNKNTYPIPRLKENFELITQVYGLLNEHIKLKIPIHPAGEWILDNYYIIEETVKNISKTLTLKKYINFLGMANGPYVGFARVFVLAQEIVAYTDGKIDQKNLGALLKAYQKKKTISMEEIWNISLFMQIALIENIRQICEKIYSSQMQKYRVENMIERLVENKQKDELQFKQLGEYKAKIKGFGEVKYPFIEYLSYRLRKYGKKAYPFLNVLEEQVNKMGLDLQDVIKKEHFDIAMRKISMGNSILSIKALNRMNMIEIFEEINGVEDILKQDPAEVYDKMDYKTKIEYRNKIKEISKKTKISEIYIAKKALELAKRSESLETEKNIETKETEDTERKKKSHIGYYILSDGKKELLEMLTEKKVKIFSNNTKVKLYVASIITFTLLITIAISFVFYQSTKLLLPTILLGILLLLPIENIVVQVIQTILGKIVKPKLIPKMYFEKEIPKEYATFVVIPTIVKSADKVKEMMKKLEVYYLANKSENLYFALLGDCSSGKNETESFDQEVIEAGLKMAEKLNKKYENAEFPKFHFLYRARTWNSKEECYIGWERKRGLLNQFNEIVLSNMQEKAVSNSFIEDNSEEENISSKKGSICKKAFQANTLENIKIPFIRYVITLDADTELTLNSGLELIGAMAHILNKPVLNTNKNLVIEGHGMMQPRIGIDLEASNKSIFTKIYAGSGGTDAYTNAISDIYQDNFEEGIFTGKGIYDLEVFSTIMKKEIPENTVLSHDLLEGNYLRCGLASDICLMDGYPTNYLSFKTRLHRWIRGDWQIIKWLGKNKKNSQGLKQTNLFTLLDKYKIVDNLMRSMQEPTICLGLLLLLLLKIIYSITIWPLVTLLLISCIIPTVLEILSRIIFRKEEEKTQKTFTKTISGVKASLLRGLFAISILPDKAYMCLNAAVKTIYRMAISKKHFLEWMTAEEAEKLTKKDIGSYYKNMIWNVIAGVVGFVALFFLKNSPYTIFLFILSSLWLIAPAMMWYISKEIKITDKLQEVSKENQQYLLEIGRKTWQYFKENCNQKSHYLPPDNYQADRNPKIMLRTSPTNIGLGMLAVISSYDLGYENLHDTLDLLEKMIQTIHDLPKWNGHLYNWYDLTTLKPLMPRYISTVDSGNFIGYLYIVKQFLKEQNREDLMMQVDYFISQADFSKLYDTSSRLFSIGFNVEENSLTDSYYDLLASEARQTSIVAIAKKDISPKHWYALSRTLTVLNKYKGLVSWSGTAFEYLMPNINIPKYPGSLLAESCQFMIMSQKEYTQKLKTPWGISESAFNVKDLSNNYQYKAFGIPWLGLKRGLADEIVVSSYGSILALPDVPNEVIRNLKILKEQGMEGKYGFYESIDYTPTRLGKNQEYAVVKTYMAHHQGLILLSINNLFHQNILQKRMMQNPELKAVSILLQERMPENMIITKEEKEKVEKIKYIDYEDYIQREVTKINPKLPTLNVIANDDYTIVMNEKGLGYSKYKNNIINRYKKTDDMEQGILFFLKNVKNKRIWTSGSMSYLSKADKYIMHFAPDKNIITRQDGNIETTTTIGIAPDDPVELRQIEIKNDGLEEETLEITSFLEPVLSKEEQDYAHKAFNNLFLSYEYLEEEKSILVKRRKRAQTDTELFMAIHLYTENQTIGELEYEIDKEKFLGRNNILLPNAVEHSIPFTKQILLTTDPIVAFRRTIQIKPKEKVSLTLIIAMGEEKQDVIERLRKYQNEETIRRSIQLSKAKVEAENRYLGVKGTEIETYQKMLSYLLQSNPFKKIVYPVIHGKAMQSSLWQYGISGDLPIILVKTIEETDSEVITEVLKAYSYFRLKNIMTDLIIIDKEKHSYENLNKESIQNAILNQNLGYLQNQKGGIHVLEDLKKEEIKLLEYRADLSIDAHYGGLKRNLKDLEEEYLEKAVDTPKEEIPQTIEENTVIRENLNTEELKYFNEYGGFSQDGTEYYIRVNKQEKLPTVWSHILANKNFGTLVTESMGGYTWYQNSRLNRLTAWNNNPVTDIPSEILYLQDKESKKIWSMGLSPCTDDNDYDVIYGFGYAKYKHTANGITQKLDLFVPTEENCKVQILTLENNELKRKKLKLVYYLKPVLGEDEIKTNPYIELTFHSESNAVILENKGIQTEEMPNALLFVSCSEKIKSYTGSKESFLGQGNLANPDGLYQVELDKQNTLWQQGGGIIAIEVETELEALESKKIVFTMGVGEKVIDCQDMAYQYSKLPKTIEEYEKTKRYWKNLIQTLQVNTPLESTNLLLNGWLIYQVLASRMWGRTGYYQSGGAYGFRDQLQDTIALKYVDPNLMKEQILKHSTHQFIEGDVEHWWHDETTRGIRTRFSDDRLWLVYLVEDYIAFTGDDSILDIETPYRVGNPLEEGIEEKYDYYPLGEEKENIYEHCKKAIQISLDFGENGLPKIGTGDWNDGLSTVGNKGKGESVWLGFFLYTILEKFIPICKQKQEENLAIEYEEIMQKLKKALNSNGWDGRWFRRAFMDDGHVLRKYSKRRM